jgi:hypothetical protein
MAEPLPRLFPDAPIRSASPAWQWATPPVPLVFAAFYRGILDAAVQNSGVYGDLDGLAYITVSAGEMCWGT